jgi:hypothetical protein
MVAAGNASAFGGAVAVMVILIYHMKGIDFPAGFEGALAVIISTFFVFARALLCLIVKRFLGVDIATVLKDPPTTGG